MNHRETITSLTVYTYANSLESQSAHSGTPRIIIIIIIIIRRARASSRTRQCSKHRARARYAYLVNVIARGTSSEDDAVLRLEGRKEEKRKRARAFWIDLDLIRFDSNARDDGGSETLVDGRCERG